MSYVFRSMPSPVGKLKLVARGDALAAVLWEDDRRSFPRFAAIGEEPGRAVLAEAEAQLGEYFAGARRTFDLPLAIEGTAFQEEVWRALLSIPYGEIRSYGQIALQVGRPRAARAVGAANGMNPLSIVAPCHRVIGGSGALTGFAGGLQAKTHLLALESAGIAGRAAAAPDLFGAIAA